MAGGCGACLEKPFSMDVLMETLAAAAKPDRS